MMSKLLILALFGMLVSVESRGGTILKRMQEMVGEMRSLCDLGCLKVTLPDEKRLHGLCLAKMIYEKKKMDSSEEDMDKWYPDTKKIATDFMTCIMEESDMLNDDGTMKEDALRNMQENYRIEGKEEDIEAAKNMFQVCVDETEYTSDTMQLAVNFNTCFIREMNKVCEERGESIGMMMPIWHAFTSLAVTNENCEAVEVNQNYKDAAAQCIEEHSDDAMEIVDKVYPKLIDLGRHVMKSMSQIFGELKEIPEIKCIHKAFEETGLMVDGKMVPSKIKSALLEMEGWANQEVANTIATKAEMCLEKGNNDASIFGMKKTSECFLPTLTENCGYDTPVSWDFLYPFLSFDRLSKLKARMQESYDNSQLKKMIDEFKDM